MDQFEFSKIIKDLVSSKLRTCLGNKINTILPPLERPSHAYSFYLQVQNSLNYVCDGTVALYKIDDCHGEEICDKERERLINDINKCDNIILFIVDVFNIR